MNDLEIVSLYELEPYELDELALDEWEEMALFEGDPDFMDTPDGDRVYFFIWKDKNKVIVDEHTLYEPELENFCNGQSCIVTLWWYSSRNETDKWKYMDENTRDEYDAYKGLKIAYRYWCGMSYTTFRYTYWEQNFIPCNK